MRSDKIRLAVTGLSGQVVSALIERSPKNVEIVALGRPQLELSRREAVLSSLRHARCDAIINAAAYTQVDKAESEAELAMRINGQGAYNVACAAAELNVPLLHLSTDYVFDGLNRPYREDDKTCPLNVYGQSKLYGENLIRTVHSRHVILRTSWIYSNYGVNFVKSMLRLGKSHDEVRVVYDQIGNPTSALDIADALIAIAAILRSRPSVDLYGTFHMSSAGETSWAEFAKLIFEIAVGLGQKPVKIVDIRAEEYPTAATRPLNSRLNTDKLYRVYGLKMPQWQTSVAPCVKKIINDGSLG